MQIIMRGTVDFFNCLMTKVRRDNIKEVYNMYANRPNILSVRTLLNSDYKILSLPNSYLPIISITSNNLLYFQPF